MIISCSYSVTLVFRFLTFSQLRNSVPLNASAAAFSASSAASSMSNISISDVAESSLCKSLSSSPLSSLYASLTPLSVLLSIFMQSSLLLLWFVFCSSPQPFDSSSGAELPSSGLCELAYKATYSLIFLVYYSSFFS